MSEWKPVQNPAMTIKLEEPIKLLGEAIQELAIRKPTPGDVFRIGIPVKHDLRDGSIDFDQRKAFPMLEQLTGIPFEGSLENMSTNDMMSAFWAMVPFFIAGMRTKPQAPATDAATSKKPDAQLAS